MTAENAAAPVATDVDQNAYAIIKARLLEVGQTLVDNTQALNQARQAVFGRAPFEVAANERVHTDNNCVPRDIIEVGGSLLFGYNVFIGLRSETQVRDVFALYAPSKRADGGLELTPVAIDGDDPRTAFLRDGRFRHDFAELYRYYKDARLLQLRLLEGPKLLAVFQIGPTSRDLKVFRWQGDKQGQLTYLDNGGLDDHTFPHAHSFAWTKATRDNVVSGKSPHINVLDTVFVDTIGGDLTIKIENNTATGLGILSEPVEDTHQSLDDAQFFYARCGALILLRVLPYRETAFRNFVFNTRTKEAHRLDDIAQSCVELPEDHGLIFPGGVALATGEVKTFDIDTNGLSFEWSKRSPNGEDVLFHFYNKETGLGVLYSYNLIDKQVLPPILAHGTSLFDDGTLIAFRAEDDTPSHSHAMRVYRTPYFREAAQHKNADIPSLFKKTGNPELVRAVSDLLTLSRLTANQKPSRALYEDLIAHANRVVDVYPWLLGADAYGLGELVHKARDTAERVLDEFDKVTAQQKRSRLALERGEADLQRVLVDVRPDSYRSVDEFLATMQRVAEARGHLLTLKEERFIDEKRIDVLAQQASEAYSQLTQKAGSFLQSAEALAPYHATHATLNEAVVAATRADVLTTLLKDIEAQQQSLKLLIEVASQLDIPDVQVRTGILDDIATLLAQFNRLRATCQQRGDTLRTQEGALEFGAQMKLLAQAVESAIAVADTVDRAERELARILLLCEDLEARFSAHTQLLPTLHEQREQAFELLTNKKQQLFEQKERRCADLLATAVRLIEGFLKRARTQKTLDALQTLVATDAMLDKARQVAAQLLSLGDSVKSEDIHGRIKAAVTEAQRSIRDQAELFVAGEVNTVQLGKHRFVTNTTPLDVVLLPHTVTRADGSEHQALRWHITGTQYFENVDDEQLAPYADLYLATHKAEDDTVARAEVLAYIVREQALAQGGLSALMAQAAAPDAAVLQNTVSTTAKSRHDEGYERGVHDVDAANILRQLLLLEAQTPLFAYAEKQRAIAALVRGPLLADDARAALVAELRAIVEVKRAYPDSRTDALEHNLADGVAAALKASGLFAALALSVEDVVQALRFDVAAALARANSDDNHFALPLSAEAFALCTRMKAGPFAQLAPRLRGLPLLSQWLLVRAVVQECQDRADDDGIATETTAALVAASANVSLVEATQATRTATGLLSQHPTIVGGALNIQLDRFLARVGAFVHERMPRFVAFQHARLERLQRARREKNIDGLKPRVLSSFVRNRLVNEVYLPLIGDNLAKQMGAAGAQKRADLMGLLLLVSPPGYGKTTLLEYVASRLGLIYIKINGPALGHETRSLDPDEAPNATARAEIEKLNFAFEMGNNILVLIDDIQHTNSEFLQKFISLCDGTRRIEGVFHKIPKQYDLRGRQVVICMAGNPYTESGDVFRIPDMLANRADTYNLGDVLSGHGEAFAQSYVENALTSNPTLQPLTSRPPEDIAVYLRMARGDATASSELRHNTSPAEVSDIVRVLQILLRIQKTLLLVNQNYIQSAAMDDRFRNEPPFKLQGSYRNMNKLAEKISPAMTDEEVDRVLDDHYQSEAQTLTSAAEENLLKLKALRQRQTTGERERHEAIVATYQRQRAAQSDPAQRIVDGLTQNPLFIRLAGLEPDAIAAAVRQQTTLIESLASAWQRRQQDG